MTQTASFNTAPAAKQPAGKLKSFFTVFKWELRNCKSPMIIFAILAGVAVTVTLTLSQLIGMSVTIDTADVNTNTADYLAAAQSAALAFQMIASYIVLYLNAIFTVIYTIRIYSYLHNKRKADMYGSLPVSRRAFYVAKTVSAFVFSVVPAMFFFGIIAVISLMFGIPVVNDVAKLYVQLLFGSASCISFYGLLAVCCGTTLNSVLTFVAVNFAYPVSAMLIKGVLKSFMYGIPTSNYNDSFIMKALNPLAAYDGTHLIYWLVFIAACLFLGIFLIKKRKAECAQTSFAYYLPCYIVKLLIAFIAGMFLGIVFASVPVFLSSYLRFCFGFILGSVPAYVITHLILYKGFSKLLKTAIPLGALALTVIVAMGCLHYDPLGYVTHVPTEDEIQSAGVVDLGNCYQAGRQSYLSIASQANDDFEDKSDVKRIVSFHESIIKDIENDESAKYMSVWPNIIMSNVPTDLLNNGYLVSYKLSNGTTLSRVYSTDMFNYGYIDSTKIDTLFVSDSYFMNYSAAMHVKPEEITNLNLYSTDSYGGSFNIDRNDRVSERKANADRELLLDAFRKDVEAHGYDDSYSGSTYTIRIRYSKTGNVDNGSFTSLLLSELTGLGSDSYYIPENYTNTIEALKELDILDSSGNPNQNSLYYGSSYTSGMSYY